MFLKQKCFKVAHSKERAAYIGYALDDHPKLLIVIISGGLVFVEIGKKH